MQSKALYKIIYVHLVKIYSILIHQIMYVSILHQ